jgi:hypothetical protein
MTRFELHARFTFSSDVSALTKEFEDFIATANASILKKGQRNSLSSNDIP